MTLKELRDNLTTLDDAHRLAALTAFLAVACEPTKNQIDQFQFGWDSSKPFEEFKVAQDKVFIACINNEVSKLGIAIRSLLGQEPLTLDTVLDIEEDKSDDTSKDD